MKIFLGMIIVTVFLGANSHANQPVRLESLVEEALQTTPT